MSETVELSEEEMDRLEREFPLAAGAAFAAARARALAAGQSVLEIENAALYEIFPDGRRRFVKAVEPATPVVAGTTIFLEGEVTRLA